MTETIKWDESGCRGSGEETGGNSGRPYYEGVPVLLVHDSGQGNQMRTLHRRLV